MPFCYVCGKDLDPKGGRDNVAFEIASESLGRRVVGPRQLEWAHRSCEERERGVDLTYSDRFEGDYLGLEEMESALDNAATSESEDAYERQQASSMGGGSFLNPEVTQRTLKR